MLSKTYVVIIIKMCWTSGKKIKRRLRGTTLGLRYRPKFSMWHIWRYAGTCVAISSWPGGTQGQFCWSCAWNAFQSCAWWHKSLKKKKIIQKKKKWKWKWNDQFFFFFFFFNFFTEKKKIWYTHTHTHLDVL